MVYIHIIMLHLKKNKKQKTCTFEPLMKQHSYVPVQLLFLLFLLPFLLLKSSIKKWEYVV